MTIRFVFLTLLAAGTLAQAADPARVVFLVRHAERPAGMSADLGITEAGHCRAEMLAGVLADAGIQRIFTTEVPRTQQTAEPLARKLRIRPEVVAAKDTDALVAKLRSGPSAPALVVGHSNTVPEIVTKLGAGAARPIEDNQYDWLFVVTVNGTQATVATLHYPACGQH